MMNEDYFSNIIDALLKEDREAVLSLVSKGLTTGIDPFGIVNEGLTKGLRKVGELFADEEIFLPGLVVAAQIVTEALETIKPRLTGGQGLAKKGLCLVATVNGDIHDIGKNLVALLLSASGYEVVNLGKSVPTETILAKTKELNPQIIGLSALLTTTMQEQKRVIEGLRKEGLREKVKVLVGGSPVTRTWALEIGADGHAEDAVSAVAEADRVMGLER
jgi:corrinoid protein of di/trimethylamine methyltransferase